MMLTACLRPGLFVALFAFTGLAAFSQKKVYRINPGERIADVVPKAEIYSYPSFEAGTVYLKGNRFSNALLNYNALYGDMQFIDPKGDTLGLADEKTIRFIVVKNDTFYFDKGYLKQLARFGDLTLVNRQYFAFANREKIGGFGETSNASIDTYDRISSATTFNELVAKEILTIVRNSVYFIGDAYNRFKPATKKGLMEVFAKQQQKLADYLQANNPDFSKEEDLRKLLSFMQTGAGNETK